MAKFQGRLATPTEISDRLYLVGYNGNEISWGSNYFTIPTGWSISISNTGLSPNTLYYVYVRPGGALELSITGHCPDSNWNECKIGDSNALLAGMVYTNPDGKFIRSAQFAYIINWHNRLPIFVAPPAAGVSISSPTWQEQGDPINRMHMLTWGYQLGIPESFTFGINGGATTSGGRVDIAFGDSTLGPELAASSWIPITTTTNSWQNACGASTWGLPEGQHTLTFWARTYSCTAQIYVNMFGNTNG